MDTKAVAQAARKRIMDRIEEDRCIHASSIEEEIERAIQAAGGPYGYVSMMVPVGLFPPPPAEDEYR